MIVHSKVAGKMGCPFTDDTCWGDKCMAWISACNFLSDKEYEIQHELAMISMDENAADAHMDRLGCCVLLYDKFDRIERKDI